MGNWDRGRFVMPASWVLVEVRVVVTWLELKELVLEILKLTAFDRAGVEVILSDSQASIV